MKSRILSLTLLHGRVDAAVRDEARRPQPDGLRLFRLKRLTLSIKDRLAALMARPAAA